MPSLIFISSLSQDMLTFLYHEGSWTRGIFRRPAGARAVRELRDALDAGESQLPLTRDHIFIIAGVFKVGDWFTAPWCALCVRESLTLTDPHLLRQH